MPGRWWRTLIVTKPASLAAAPAFASARGELVDVGTRQESETTTTECFRSASATLTGSPWVSSFRGGVTACVCALLGVGGASECVTAVVELAVLGCVVLVLRTTIVAAGDDDDHHEQDDEPELARAQRRVHGPPIGRPGGAGLPETGDTSRTTGERERARSPAPSSVLLSCSVDYGQVPLSGRTVPPRPDDVAVWVFHHRLDAVAGGGVGLGTVRALRPESMPCRPPASVHTGVAVMFGSCRVREVRLGDGIAVADVGSSRLASARP